jgi:tetratricopeptide (TPR) repeat protein
MQAPALLSFLALGILAAQEPPPDLDQSLKASRASFSKGDYESARKSIEEAWKLAEQTPADDLRRYEVLKQFSAVLAATRAYTEAENYLQLAINWRENTNGLDDPKVADDLIDLVALCRGEHDFARGLVVQERIVQIHMKSGGARDALLADDFDRKAQLHLNLKDPEKAVGAFQTALIFRESSAGPDHPAILPDLDHLAIALVTVRRYDRAEEVYRRALILRERLYGPTHADLLATLDGLAYSLFGQKKYDDAEPVYKRLLALWETSAGPGHPMVALMLDKMTTFYRDQQKWDQAKETAARAIAVRETFSCQWTGTGSR